MDRDQDLLRCGPLRLQLILVHTLLQDPAQTRHGLHPVEQSWVLGRVFVTLREQNDNGSIRTSAKEPKTSPPVCGDGTTRPKAPKCPLWGQSVSMSGLSPSNTSALCLSSCCGNVCFTGTGHSMISDIISPTLAYYSGTLRYQSNP